MDPRTVQIEKAFLTIESGLLRSACFHMRNQQDAEDLLQDAWLRLCTVKHFPDYSSSWMQQAMKRIAIDVYRRKQLERKHLGTKVSLEEGFYQEDKDSVQSGESVEEHANWDPNPTIVMIGGFDRDWIPQAEALIESVCWGESGQRMRQAVLLKLHGFLAKEIGEILAIKENAVKALLWRARQRLISELEDMSVELSV